MKKWFYLLLILLVLSPLILIFWSSRQKLVDLAPIVNQTKSEPKIIRSAAVAGQFYKADSQELAQELNQYLTQAEYIPSDQDLQILIVPHAGTRFSGSTAAWGFKQLENKDISRVILLGSSHNYRFEHAAVFDEGAWQTPLGQVEIDEVLARSLISQSPGIQADQSKHDKEHSLEMEVIFLQQVLSDFKIVPILLGQPSNQLTLDLAQAISNNLDEETILIISTDLSHYPTYEVANQVDGQTIEAILTGNSQVFENTIQNINSQNLPGLDTCACAHEAIKTALTVAQNLPITDFKKLNYSNSGDVGGDENRVVGYAAIASYGQAKPKFSYKLDKTAQEEALEIARQTLETYLQTGQKPDLEINNSILNQKLGAFVTLNKNEQLRGCIGRFEPDISLAQVIQDMAIAAATADARFSPVKASELNQIEIEISVMAPKQEIDHWQDIVLGQDGVVIEQNDRSGTFLPQVATDSDWDKEKFLSELCSQKAHLPPDCYKNPKTKIYTFQAQVFSEK